MPNTAPVDQTRVRVLSQIPLTKPGPVVYWMSRDQRVHDNWALIYAREQAEQWQQPLWVVFNLVPKFLGATARQYDFMLAGLEEVEAELRDLGIGFAMLQGEAVKNVSHFAKECAAGLIVVDMSPLRIGREWRDGLASKSKIAVHEVDAHNIVPVWEASPKQEFGAYTIRPKIHRLLDDYLTEFPKVKSLSVSTKSQKTDWRELRNGLTIDESVAAVTWLKPGAKAAAQHLHKFIETRLSDYDEKRNDPNEQVQSDLSPYFHFGQLAPQRAALAVRHLPNERTAGFLEELIIRRELADNFCFYNQKYDEVAGCPAWGQETLNQHRADVREYVYTRQQLELAQTHDPLWNAAQTEMRQTGKMHNYMRMYWAKKILEWTISPEAAMAEAIYLNDKYELDGRDPNGYVGIAWSIGGLHDRAWAERPVFGKIRYMNYNGAKSKFSVDKYVAKFAARGAQSTLL